jgi:hypothetical protein
MPAMPPPSPPDALTKAERRIAELERKIGRQQVELVFYQALRRSGSAPAERRVWRYGVSAVIQTMTTPRPQGDASLRCSHHNHFLF